MILVVYHCHLVNNWKEIVTDQLTRVKNSGLYDSADQFWVTVNLMNETEDEFKQHVKEYEKLQFVFRNDNGAEYPGIHKVKELGNLYDSSKIFYFHTKGVSNTYEDWYNRGFSLEKVNNIKAWRECLEYFLIDRWQECVNKLDENDNVGVTCNANWYWGNFWWTNSKHVKKCIEVNFWGRWDYEAWLNNSIEQPKNFEWFKFIFNPYVTNIDQDWYKKTKISNRKINLLKATYGTAPFHIDEGYCEAPLNAVVDITKDVEKKLEEQNYEKFQFYAINSADNEDPAPHKRKFVFLEYCLDGKLEKVYKIGLQDGTYFDFEP